MRGNTLTTTLTFIYGKGGKQHTQYEKCIMNTFRTSCWYSGLYLQASSNNVVCMYTLLTQQGTNQMVACYNNSKLLFHCTLQRSRTSDRKKKKKNQTERQDDRTCYQAWFSTAFFSRPTAKVVLWLYLQNISAVGTQVNRLGHERPFVSCTCMAKAFMHFHRPHSGIQQSAQCRWGTRPSLAFLPLRRKWQRPAVRNRRHRVHQVP